jgi:hypothetical protein
MMATRRETAAGQLTFTDAPRPSAPPAVKPTRATAVAAVGDSLPQLLDRKGLAAETGLPRSAIDVIFRHCPVVALPGHRKVYVRRADVSAYFDQHTFRDDRVRPNAEAA